MFKKPQNFTFFRVPETGQTQTVKGKKLTKERLWLQRIWGVSGF